MIHDFLSPKDKGKWFKNLKTDVLYGDFCTPNYRNQYQVSRPRHFAVFHLFSLFVVKSQPRMKLQPLLPQQYQTCALPLPLHPIATDSKLKEKMNKLIKITAFITRICSGGWYDSIVSPKASQQEGNKSYLLPTVSARRHFWFHCPDVPSLLREVQCCLISLITMIFLLKPHFWHVRIKNLLGEDVAGFWSHTNNIPSIQIWPVHYKQQEKHKQVYIP